MVHHLAGLASSLVQSCFPASSRIASEGFFFFFHGFVPTSKVGLTFFTSGLAFFLGIFLAAALPVAAAPHWLQFSSSSHDPLGGYLLPCPKGQTASFGLAADDVIALLTVLIHCASVLIVPCSSPGSGCSGFECPSFVCP